MALRRRPRRRRESAVVVRALGRRGPARMGRSASCSTVPRESAATGSIRKATTMVTHRRIVRVERRPRSRRASSAGRLEMSTRTTGFAHRLRREESRARRVVRRAWRQAPEVPATVAVVIMACVSRKETVRTCGSRLRQSSTASGCWRGRCRGSAVRTRRLGLLPEWAAPRAEAPAQPCHRTPGRATSVQRASARARRKTVAMSCSKPWMASVPKPGRMPEKGKAT